MLIVLTSCQLAAHRPLAIDTSPHTSIAVPHLGELVSLYSEPAATFDE
jgi:hypothetical protein